jgi:catalase
MHGFGTNTFVWYNGNNYCFVKYHIKTNQGIKNLLQDEADIIAGKDPDYSINDLYENISKGNYPSWKVFVQIMTIEQAKKYKFDPFDATKVWYHNDFPLIPLGKIILNKNPKNFFTDIEQLAFSPSHFVNGIGPSQDKLLQGRLFAYPDAHRHRIGTNVNQLKVNQTKNTIPITYQKDGNMADTSQGNTKLNYFPNSYEDVYTNENFKLPEQHIEGIIKRHIYPDSDIDFEQPGELYRRVMNEEQKNILVDNLCNSLKLADLKLQYRQTSLFYKTDVDLGTRISEKLNLNLETVKSLSNMTQEQRVNSTK